MKAHRFDPLSFLFGIAFVALAGVLSTPGLDIDSDGLRWVGALVLLGVGAVLLLGSRGDSRDES